MHRNACSVHCYLILTQTGMSSQLLVFLQLFLANMAKDAVFPTTLGPFFTVLNICVLIQENYSGMI
jgi:hypothetical protein